MKIFQMKFAGRALAVEPFLRSLGRLVLAAPITMSRTLPPLNPYRGSPLPRQALADEVYLDGTGVTACRGGAPDTSVETVHVTPPASGPSHAVVRSRHGHPAP